MIPHAYGASSEALLNLSTILAVDCAINAYWLLQSDGNSHLADKVLRKLKLYITVER